MIVELAWSLETLAELLIVLFRNSIGFFSLFWVFIMKISLARWFERDDDEANRKHKGNRKVGAAAARVNHPPILFKWGERASASLKQNTRVNQPI